jgi:hypothetical protein
MGTRVTGWRKAYLSALWVWYRSELTITEPGYTRKYILSQTRREIITENFRSMLTQFSK